MCEKGDEITRLDGTVRYGIWYRTRVNSITCFIFSCCIIGKGSEHLPDLALGERHEGLFNQEPGVEESVHSTAGQMLQRCSRAQGIQPTAHSLFMDNVFLCNIWEKIQLTPEHFAMLAFFFLNKTCTVIYQPLEKVPVITSFADPDPASGIRCLFDP